MKTPGDTGTFPLPYDPQTLPRELARHYIPASDDEIQAMLRTVGAEGMRDLFRHIQPELFMPDQLEVPEELGYQETKEHLVELAAKNHVLRSFVGDGLPQYRVPEISAFVASIRTLTTSYTPYQPERSQGTLMTHWIYQCSMAMLTGFEAINSSLYERATALFEAFCCAIRLTRGTDTVIVSGGIFPGDLAVIHSLAQETKVRIVEVAPDSRTGRLDTAEVRKQAEAIGSRLAAIAFPQVNTFGILEEVDELTDLAADLGAKSIAIIDPMHLATGGLKPPARFGRSGANMFVGEGQHLAIGPNFGGPGLGIFGVRYNAQVRNDIRATPGRYVGKGKDLDGRECLVMVLSTREQHIRREKATSNICSNQAFLATLAGAAILQRGEQGMSAACRTGAEQARRAATRLTSHSGVNLAHPQGPFFNEFVLTLPVTAEDCISAGREFGLHVGVNVSDRFPGSNGNHLKLSFTDWQTEEDLERLFAFFSEAFGPGHQDKQAKPADVPGHLLREEPVGLPQLSLQELKGYYTRLGELNISPDEGCYPLGSCTMKYNPHLNDFTAGLPGFTDLHPQADIRDAQGTLEVLYRIQEWFKGITGLAGVTTQPVAGAQGELVGLKMFQAYHRAQGEKDRDVVLIPRSSHGTNFATAAMAGFEAKPGDGLPGGIVLLEADETGQIDMASLRQKIDAYGRRISGIMITNPNTGGIFESNFREIADLVHQAGGLVYMDGANMNAIAGWIDLGKLGVDAVHNNLHKTWTIPHGGGGPGDAIVAVSEKLVDFLPGAQIAKGEDGTFHPVVPQQSMGSVHRHWGNFAHKIRAYTYLVRLGREGVKRMSAMAVLSSRYVSRQLEDLFPALPPKADGVERMHEFIITLPEDLFDKIEAAGVPRASIIPRVGKLFLDFGYHAPTVAFPEAFGLMIETTESYTRDELDRFAATVQAIGKLIREHPEVLKTAPHFTPIDRVDEVAANRELIVSEPLRELRFPPGNRVHPRELLEMDLGELSRKIIAAASEQSA
jgi:glycine dehydrogenase